MRGAFTDLIGEITEPSMSVEFQCPCGKRLRLSAAATSGQGRCPACGRVLDIPTAEQTAFPPGVFSLPVDTSTALTDEPSGQQAERTAVTEAASEPREIEELADQASELPVLTRPGFRLASPGQIGLAGFLGGPLGGFLLMGRNYAKCSRQAACWATIVAVVLVTAAAVGAGFVLPTNPILNLGLAVPLWLGTYLTARFLQQRTFEAHQKEGGEQVSGWAVVGFTLLGVVLTLGSAVGAAVLYEVGFGDHRLEVNAKEEIYYSRDIKEAEARTLARVLQEQRFFNGASEKTVRLHKDGQEYVLAFVPSPVKFLMPSAASRSGSSCATCGRQRRRSCRR
jgi:hypothetical protein